MSKGNQHAKPLDGAGSPVSDCSVCACGCGQKVITAGRKWAAGHHMRRPEYREKAAAIVWKARKGYTRSSAEKAGKAISEGWRSGKRKARDTNELLKTCAKAGKRVTERKISVNQRIAKSKIGKPNPPGISAKGPGHFKARFWRFRSPNNIVIEGWNLNELVRKHSKLFLPEDLVWKKARCRATHGLRSLYSGRANGPCSWHGWVAMAVWETEEDIIGRPKPNAEVCDGGRKASELKQDANRHSQH